MCHRPITGSQNMPFQTFYSNKLTHVMSFSQFSGMQNTYLCSGYNCEVCNRIQRFSLNRILAETYMSLSHRQKSEKILKTRKNWTFQIILIANKACKNIFHAKHALLLIISTQMSLHCWAILSASIVAEVTQSQVCPLAKLWIEHSTATWQMITKHSRLRCIVHV